MKAPAGLHLRQVSINGIGPWMWREADYWAWTHPLQEFPALRDLILTHAKDTRVMVQAGGCMGMYPRLWADFFRTVVTFEPDPVNFYCLVANCPNEGIIKLQVGLTDTAGMCALKAGPDFNAGLGSLHPDPAGSVAAVPLDALALPVVDAIQLDCEGGEDKVIAGAIATIARCRPVISIERPGDELRKTLADIGYAEVGRCGTMPDVVFAT